MPRSVALALVLELTLAGGCTKAPEPPRRIALVYYSPHAVIETVVRGFRAGLAAELPTGSYEILEHRVFDPMQGAFLAHSVLEQRPSVVVPTGTLLSQAFLSRGAPQCPVVFLAVTDPVSTGLVTSWEHPERCTGIADSLPIEEQLRLIRKILPAARVLGLLYDPGSSLAISERDRTLRLAPELGFAIDARPMERYGERTLLLQRLVATSDALIVGASPSGLEFQAVSEGLAARKPVFGYDSRLLQEGALGIATIDYEELGRDGARRVALVLRGEKAGSIPVGRSKANVAANPQIAERLGIRLPPDLRTKETPASTVRP
jgi:putative ABC transport system substrate-binding protein